MFYNLKNFLISFSEKLFFYDHFLDNNSNLILDFDKKGYLIFQNLQITTEISQYLKIEKPSFDEKTIKKIHFLNFFPLNNPVYQLTVQKLQSKNNLKNIEECLHKKLKYNAEKNMSYIDENSQNFKILLRSKSKSFKGFYILVMNDSRNLE